MIKEESSTGESSTTEQEMTINEKTKNIFLSIIANLYNQLIKIKGVLKE